MIIYGLNPVLEALRAGGVRRLRVGTRGDRRVEEAITLARQTGVTVERVDRAALDRAAAGGVHQGIVAEVGAPRDYSIRELIDRAAPAAPLLVVLDAIEDPQNVGAILRTADAAGVHGVIRQSRHSASLDGVVAKASAGAVAHVRVATVVNIARAIDELKEAGVWSVGLAGDAPESYDVVDFTLPTAVVLGAEGAGLRRLVRERCDRLAAIPMHGAVGSLNVSVAAGVVLFEAARQRASEPGVERSRKT
ncbi:MAG: 23S rRNA (guanosine(2251)-2'-O)-methyltransferase RlmB [Acidobacteria bacterium RIFCSPLOWO2_02_FULL_67_36]|nr:MAG: 23S rRNA (guanosine(2251)-2'-O)-methyltransferase RlmB [Acidobacteria bacterium RIFCSPLOWO2_02_FULL_67_36]OFW21452.1 MAG: 23S rRNA (guanosine(2251)-2'-O)-methyltransferase RlmB [Acidobacteria bacterium RIFCSPLOWO2_12_FULL_66_21]